MTPERYKQLMHIVDQLLDRPAEDREAILAQFRNGEDSLRRDVEQLLGQQSSITGFLEHSPIEALSDAEIDSMIGWRIGPYRIVEAIGRGGMGAVYKAVRADDEYKTEVAIKLIKRGMDTDYILRRFRNERQILANLNHPNIARLLDGGTTEDGLPYFVMEYIAGEPIDDYCAERNLSITERLKLFRAACSAVQYAHRNLVIHRDLKPSNILVTKYAIPKLLDFGIAKLLQTDGDTSVTALTATELRVMTPHYASPEQVKGAQITTASDVYSLGVVLYELLTGRRPYRIKSKSPDEVARVICEQEPERPSKAANSPWSADADANKHPPAYVPTRGDSELRGDLDAIVLMALRKEPERRYSSVEQFSEDIDNYLQRRPVAAHPDSFSYRATKFVRRHRPAVLAATIVLVILIAGIVTTTYQARVARVERAKAERRFNDVRKLAHLLMFDYHDAIATLPGSTELRKQLVKDALDYLNRLSEEAIDDRSLLRDMGTAYHRIGDIQGGVMTSASGGTLTASNLGDTAGALESYRRALEIRERLAALDPANKEIRMELGTSVSRMGEISLVLGKPAEALEYLRRGAAIYEELIAADPSDKVIRIKLSSFYFTIGRILGVPGSANLGDTDGALVYLRKSEEMDRALLAEEPSNPKHRQGLAADLGNIGRVLASDGRHAEALASFQQALEMGKRLANDYPQNTLYQRELAAQHINVGTELLAVGDKAGALNHVNSGIEIRETMLSKDPKDANMRRDLANGYRIRGEVLAATYDRAGATEGFQKALTLFSELATNDPRNASFKYQKSLTHLKFSEFLLKTNDISPALREAAAAVSINEILISTNPQDASARRTLALAYSQSGRINAHLASQGGPLSKGRWEAAREWFQKSLVCWNQLKQEGRLNKGDTNQPDETNREIQKCDAALKLE